MDAEQTCARCGHTTPTCARCGKNDPLLGGMVGGQDYCHTFSEDSPTCYMVASRLPRAAHIQIRLEQLGLVDPERMLNEAIADGLIDLSAFTPSDFTEVDRPK